MLATACLLLIKVGLSLLGLPRCYHLLAKWPIQQRKSGKMTTIQAYSLAQTIRQAAQHVARANCLPQSLLLWWWLRQKGKPSQLCIGIDSHTAHFAAHAWVEVDGVPMAEAEGVAERFVAFDNLSAALERVQFS